MLNANRRRTFDEARLEVRMFVEAKFGLRIRNANLRDNSSRSHNGPMDVDALSSLAGGEGERREWVVSGAVEIISREIAPNSTRNAKAMARKVKKSKSWPKSVSKRKGKEKQGTRRWTIRTNVAMTMTTLAI